jgi:methionine synthase II (cobalamin-independent)
MSAKLHRSPPFRAEHLGSLLRTEKLLEARHAWEAGKGTEADLKPIEDQDVKDIVKIQQDLGFRMYQPQTWSNPCRAGQLTNALRWHH